jgi:threonine/homoserine/homoserine lactone efflux protein
MYGQLVAEAPAVLTFLMLGAGIGFVAGLSPGPVLTLVVQETLRGRWPRGAAVAAGPLLADGPIIAVAVLVVGQLPPGFVPAISLVGGLFLLYLAVTTGLTARQAALSRGQRLAAKGGLLTGLLARASSPNPYLFWVLVGTPALLQAGGGGWWSGAAFLLGYYAMIVGSNVGLGCYPTGPIAACCCSAASCWPSMRCACSVAGHRTYNAADVSGNVSRAKPSPRESLEGQF